MASTRDKNSVYNYNSFKKSNKEQMNYNTNYNSTHNKYCNITLGGLQKCGTDVLSKNNTDIESFLRGTYLNNLEEMKTNFEAEIIQHDSVSFFKRPVVLMPYPLITTTKKSRFI